MRWNFLFIICVFFFIEIADFLLPYSSGGDVYYYYLSFFVFVLISGILVMPLGGLSKDTAYYISSKVSAKTNGSLFSLALSFLSLVGVLFIFYDRTFIQGIDYSLGVSAARESWREISSARGGVSSIYSVLGNLFYSIVFLSLVHVILFWEEVKFKRLAIFLSMFSIVIYSLMTGGRTSFLVMVLCAASAATVRKSFFGKAFLPDRFYKYAIIMLILSCAGAYFVFMFRISMSEIDEFAYANNLAVRLKGVRSGSDFMIADPVVNSILIYVAHVKWVAVEIMQSSQSDGVALFNEFFTILSTRLTLLSEWQSLTEWQFSGLWAPLLSLAYYDIGFLSPVFLGFIFGSYFLMFGIIRRNAYLSGILLPFMPVHTLVVAVFIASPFCALFEIVEFIYSLFMGFVFLILYCLSSFFKSLLFSRCLRVNA